MALTLQKICENAAKRYGMRLEAGKNGLQNTIKWIHTLESEQAAGFLHGGELIFTTGVGADGEDWLLRFAKVLHRQEACGLVVNTGAYVTVLPESLKAYCREWDFPLFTVPWETRLVDMTRDFCNRIIEAEKKEESISEMLQDLILQKRKPSECIPLLEKNDIPWRAGCRILCLSLKEQSDRLPEHYREFLSDRIERIFCEKAFCHTAFGLDGIRVFVLFGCREEEETGLIREILALRQGRETLVELCIGTGAGQEGLEQLGENYRRARKLLSVCIKQKKSCIRYEELELEKLFLDVRRECVLREYYDRYVGRLLAYDAENGTEYTKVLEAYLELDGSIRQAADRLFVHRNTINYQLNRIKKILGCEISTLEEKMRLRLAFLIGEFL